MGLKSKMSWCVLSSVLAASGGVGGAEAAVLAGWDNWANNGTTYRGPYGADLTAAGFSGTVTLSTSLPTNSQSGSRVNAGFGSTDGTFGSEAGASSGTAGAGVSDGALLVRSNNSELTLTLVLTNGSGQAATVDSFHFDFAARSQDSGSNGPNGFNLTYTGGGLAPAATSIATQTGIPYTITGTTNAISDFNDYNFSLASSLSDITLGNGESATFTLTFSMPSSNASPSVSSVIDNIAFVTVPEPASFALIGLGALLIASRRSNR